MNKFGLKESIFQSILDVFDWALDVGGADHHLRAVQLPYGVAAAAYQGPIVRVT